MKVRFLIYLLSITLLSISISNVFYTFEESIFNLALIITLSLTLVFHSFYYKVHNTILKINKNEKSISTGLFVSSIVGAILSLIITLYAINYPGPSNFDKYLGMNEAIVTFLFYIGAVNLFLIILCIFVDIIYTNKISRTRIIIGSIVFYLLNLGASVGLVFITVLIRFLITPW